MSDENPSDPPTPPDPFAGADWGGGLDWMSPPDRTKHSDETHVRRVRVRTGRKRRRRRGLVIGLGVLGLLLVAGGWLLYTGLAAKSQLETVRDEVHRLRTEIDNGDLDEARSTAAQISTHARRAHDLTTGPLWAVGAAIPLAGDPLESVRTLTTSVSAIADGALPSLVDASRSLDPKTLRSGDGSINLAPIAAVAPALDRATAVMDHALARINALPHSTWLGAVNSARADALKQLTPLTKTVQSADIAADTLPTLLGANGPQSYLISFENEAELRGTGGLPGAFAIVKADRGRLSFSRFEPDNTLYNVPSGLDLGTDFDRTYDAPDIVNDYRDSDMSPNFPYAARIWLAEWKKVSGQSLDGAITLDPTALSYLLEVTGPAKLPDHTEVSADNVVKLTQQTVYSKFSTAQNAERKQYLLDIAKAVSERLVTNHGSTSGLVKAAGRAASQRRLLVWSADPTIEAKLAGTAISGALPQTTAPFALVAINNYGANKLDYYLHAKAEWRAESCGSTRRVQVTITLHNEAPLGLPKYVLGFTGRPGFPQQPGDNALRVGYYGTPGGVLTSMYLNGKASTIGSGAELGHPVYILRLSIPRGSTQTIVLNLLERGSGVPTLHTQPMVNPMTASVVAAAC